MTKPEKERRTEGNVGVQPKNLTLWEARQAVWRDRFAGLFMVRLFFCVAAFGGWMLKNRGGQECKTEGCSVAI